VRLIGPDEGAMACGEWGPGRMAEPEAIRDAALAMLEPAQGEAIRVPPPPSLPAAGPLAGRRALVTAGPTQEPLDPVRFLSNRSSGKQGYAVAQALAEAGADVTLVSGPVALDAPAGVRRVWVETAAQMADACEAALPADVAVLAAAVADWRPAAPAARKLKKGDGAPELRLEPTADVLQRVSEPGPRRPALVVGFAAETDHLLAHARDKLARKGCDWIVANDVGGDVMGGAENEVTLLTGAGEERWPRLSKAETARRLAERVAEALAEAGPRAADASGRRA
jgi:phosphopantothenoylcysteine decarboxylase / phosphopantothenate---cysteine ligase